MNTETVALLLIPELKRLSSAARPSLKALLLSDNGRTDFEIPPRGSARRRPVNTL